MDTTGLGCALDVARQRDQFPAFTRELRGQPAVYFDGPAGSQVPDGVISAISRYLIETNANRSGMFATARESDRLLQDAHAALADFVGAADPDTIIFGQNMTTLTFAISRALARTWQPGSEILVTELDHDANVTPWVLAARDAGVKVQQVRLRPENCTLDMGDLREKLTEKTALLAVGGASNAVGTLNPLREIIELAHGVGAKVYVDAVHLAPHALLEAEAWGCDFLVCSAYKFFGPHVGVLYGRRDLLEELEAYKVRPAPHVLPGKWMTGTQNHEGIAGTLAAVDYLTDLGRSIDPLAETRRASLAAAYGAIQVHERALAAHFLTGLKDLPSVRLYGLNGLGTLTGRVATFSFTHARHRPKEVAEYLGQHGIFVWHGNYYALPLTEALDLEPAGMVRVGMLHYNTHEEVDRLLQALEDLE